MKNYRAAADIKPVNDDRWHRAITNALVQLVGVVDADAALCYANPQWYAYTGSIAIPGGVPDVVHLVHSDDAQMFANALATCGARGETCCEVRIRRTDGAYRWHEVRVVPLERSDPPTHWAFTCTDIEEHRAARAALADLTARLVTTAVQDRALSARLREKNRLMEMAELTAHFGHWRLDLATDELYWSDQVFRTYGLAPTTAPTLEAALLGYHPADRERVSAIVQTALLRGTPFAYEARIVRPGGEIRAIVSSGQSESAPDGTVTAIFGVFQDVTDTKNAERERVQLLERINVATQAAQIGIWEWELASNELVWDQVMFALFGLPQDGPAPSFEQFAACLHPDDRSGLEHDIQRALADEKTLDTEFRALRPSGEMRHIRAMAKVVRNDAGAPLRMIGSNWDISEVRLLADALRREKDAATFAAAHDTLTGLLNRRGLEAWIEAQPNARATLLYLDIDGFKAVNDRGGHDAGDEALRRVAGIIRETVREEDAAARFGGDEFIVVLRDLTDHTTTRRVIARIVSAVDALCPLGAEDTTRIGMSIGVGHLRGRTLLRDALREADAELYQRKSERKRAAATAQ